LKAAFEKGAAMRGDPANIRLLNSALTNELTAVNPYSLHARMFQTWGCVRFGKIVHAEPIEEMNHADRLETKAFFFKALGEANHLQSAMGEMQNTGSGAEG
jgi:bacterioferritin